VSAEWEIRRLCAGDDRTAFDCGKSRLNDWLKRLAGQYERRDLARTYVAVRTAQAWVVGYYALTTHRVRYQALPADLAKGLPHVDVPVVLLGQLAVDKGEQGRGFGEHLLVDALRRITHIADHVGVRAIEVHALDDEARSFYLKYGFASLEEDRHHLYLPMRAVRRLELPPLRP